MFCEPGHRCSKMPTVSAVPPPAPLPIIRTDSIEERQERLDTFTSDLRPLPRQGSNGRINARFLLSADPPSHPAPLRRKSAHLPVSERVLAVRREGSRRRLSHVEVMARRLSTSLACSWRSYDPGELVQQTRALCSQYIRARLKRSGLFSRRLGLQRLGSLTGERDLCEVFQELALVGSELERLHPTLYTAISRQINVPITSEKTVRILLSSFAADIFSSDINWAKIVSLYAVTAGLAVECVKLGHPEYLSALIDTVGVATERDAGQWIASQGGWISLATQFRPTETEPSVGGILMTVAAGLVALALGTMFMARLLGKALIDFG